MITLSNKNFKIKNKLFLLVILFYFFAKTKSVLLTSHGQWKQTPATAIPVQE